MRRSRSTERRTWLRLVTALAKYLTAEYAIAAARAALELIGGNGYTSDYPVARLLRDAQVLTVWEGPANIQALELLRLLAPRYRDGSNIARGCRESCNKLPEGLGNLRKALQARLDGDREALAVTMRDEQSAQRYARKLLHRMSQSLAFALLCEAARDAHRQGNSLPAAQRMAVTTRRSSRRPSALRTRPRGAACLELLEEESVAAAVSG